MGLATGRGCAMAIPRSGKQQEVRAQKGTALAESAHGETAMSHEGPFGPDEPVMRKECKAVGTTSIDAQAGGR